jgi:serine/threonine protein kinase/WD40 repeat protein
MATFHLVIEPPSGGRYEHRLGAGSYVLGREQGMCDVAIVSPEISRRHVRLTLGETQCTVEDLGSTSGTYHSGQAMRESHALAYPLELHLGTVRLHISLAKESAGDTNGSGVAGHYTKGAEIAKGGMGAVLEANDQLLGRTVAMKVVRHDIGDSESIRLRFIREATVLARLEHPSIVPIYEMGKDAEGRLYYTMKKVEGRTLQALLDDLKAGKAATVKEYTLDRLLNIYRKICEAMAFAHAKGVIHRDLKPENVMVGQFGEVLVMDWGLAKVLYDVAQTAQEMQLLASAGSAATNPKESTLPTGFAELSDSQLRGSSQNLTVDGAVMGSPQYMPPEQAEGKVGDLDERADVFSLGGILYAILTLRPPVEGRTVKEVLDKVKSGNIVPPTHFNIGSSSSKGKKLPAGNVTDPKLITPLPHCPGGRVPGTLSAVTMKALSFDREQRYGSTGELLADVEAYQRGFATSAENVNLLGQLGLLVKRHKTFASALAVIALLTVGFMIKVVSSERKALANAVEAEKSALQAKEAGALAVQKEQEARKALAKSALSLAEAAMREADGMAMQSALNDVPEDLRDSTWSYLLAKSDSSIARVRIGATPTEGAAADPSRPGVFALADQNRKVTIMNVRTGERLMEFEPAFSTRSEANQYRLAFSPDGQRLAVAREGPGGIVVHQVRDGAKVKEWATPASVYMEFGDNEKLLRHGAGSLQVWNSVTGSLLWEDKQSGVIGVLGVFLPGGNEVLKVTLQNRLQVVRASDGGLVRNLGGRMPTYQWTMLVHPDGQSVYTYTVGGSTECVSLLDGKTLFALPQKQARGHIGITSDGEQLVTATFKSDGGQLIEVWEARTGNAIRSLLGGQGHPVNLSVHPRSKELLISGANTRVWDLTGQLPRWRMQSYHMGRPVFWGSDDQLLSNAYDSWGLVGLRPSGTEFIWQPANRLGHTAAISADASLAVLSRPGFSNAVQLLRRTGSKVEEFGKITAEFWPYRLRPSPDGKSLALMERAHTAKLQIFSIASGKVSVRLELENVNRINDLDWLGNDRLVGLVTVNSSRGNMGAEERILLWDATSGKLLKSATNATAMDALAVAPDGRRFAEAGADKFIRIRETSTLAIQSAFRAHDAPITVLAWHPNQPRIASGSEDLSIKVLDIEREHRISEFLGLLNPPDHLIFSSTGKRLVTKTAIDQLIRIWDLSNETTTPQRPQGTSKAATNATAVSASQMKTGEWENLIAQLTPAVVRQTGRGWRMDNGVLFSPAGGFASLPLPGNLSGTSYQVRVRLRRLSEKLLFNLQLPVADRLVSFQLDAHPDMGGYTGLTMVQGKALRDLPGVARGKMIKDADQHDLEVTVRLDGGKANITATLDALSLYEWNGPVADLSTDPRWATPAGNLAVGSNSIDWVVYEVKVKRL